MQLFFSHKITGDQAFFDVLESGHLVQSLRKKTGDIVHFTDGKGGRFAGKLLSADKKAAVASIETKRLIPAPQFTLHLVVAPTKQHDRMEWLVEKSVELGVLHLTFCVTQRAERNKIRMERLEKIALSAMKQSLQSHLPVLSYYEDFTELCTTSHKSNAFIAACLDEPPPHLSVLMAKEASATILIGPEGDFTLDEISTAEEQGFKKISLGQNRLRTETAALYAATVFKTLNQL